MTESIHSFSSLVICHNDRTQTWAFSHFFNDMNENINHVFMKIMEVVQNIRIQNYLKLNQRTSKMEIKKLFNFLSIRILIPIFSAKCFSF